MGKKLEQSLHIGLIGAQAQKIRFCAVEQSPCIGQMRIESVGVLLPEVQAGRIDPDLFAGFGIGSAMFTPGLSADEVGQRARKFVAAWRAAQAG